MSKIRIVQIIGYCLFAIYIALIISEIVWGYLGDYRSIIFSIFLAIVSLSMIVKGVFLKSQSTLWFANTLLIYAIVMLIFDILNLDYILYNYIFILIPIISSLINIVSFHNLIYIKVIILNFTIVIPIVLSKFLHLDSYLYWIIGIVSVVIGVFVCRMVKMDKEKI